jgi:hypothetical protein
LTAGPTRAGVILDARSPHTHTTPPTAPIASIASIVMCATDRSLASNDFGPFRLQKKIQLHKTALCRHYQAFGSCSYGDQCGFAHGVQELLPMCNLYKTRLCNIWLSGQECAFGDKCMFAHGAADLRKPTTLSQPCHLLRTSGFCAYGDNCRYSHDTTAYKTYSEASHKGEVVVRPVTPQSSPVKPRSSPPGAPVKRHHADPLAWSPFEDDNFGTSLLDNVSKQLFKFQL